MAEALAIATKRLDQTERDLADCLDKHKTGSFDPPRTYLRRLFQNRLSQSELATVVFDYGAAMGLNGFSIEDLPGETMSESVLWLIDHADNREGGVRTLVNVARSVRPDLDWPTL